MIGFLSSYAMRKRFAKRWSGPVKPVVLTNLKGVSLYEEKMAQKN